ncbi:unnamed protein product [Blepharisma stoltei]|uniref:Uncharacterized protein n=1 Tax=Blepharisma stoltei TaxID=1481888 RepID=A0AAU9IQR2_9CILI|nr:unnamed protein product [Blepharisma stoltei]
MGINCCKQSTDTVSDPVQPPSIPQESKTKAVLDKKSTKKHTIKLDLTQNNLYRKRKTQTPQTGHSPSSSEISINLN